MLITNAKLPLYTYSLVEYTNSFFRPIKVPYALAVKSLRCAKDVHELILQITSISVIYSKILRVLEPLKILHIPLYSIKGIHAAVTMLVADEVESRVFAIWRVYSSLKKITSGISALVGVLEEFAHLSPVCRTYLEAASFFFLPTTLIATAVGSYKTFQRSVLFFESSNYLNKKMETRDEVIQACLYLQRHEEKLHSLKVYTKKNDFNSRVQALYDRMQKSSEVPQDAQVFFHIIQRRMKHLLIHEGMRTAIKVTNSVTMILLACNAIAALPLVVLELACSVGRLGIYLYAKHIQVHGASAIPN